MQQPTKFKKNNLIAKKMDKIITKDHFIIQNNKMFAGKHLILDLWYPKYENSISFLKNLIKKAAKVSRATLLHIHLHRFGKEQGISGVAILAESHISVHTWPERKYIAFDIFMCGDTEPLLAINFLVSKLKPTKKLLKTIKRGVTPIDL